MDTNIISLVSFKVVIMMIIGLTISPPSGKYGISKYRKHFKGTPDPMNVYVTDFGPGI